MALNNYKWAYIISYNISYLIIKKQLGIGVIGVIGLLGDIGVMSFLIFRSYLIPFITASWAITLADPHLLTSRSQKAEVVSSWLSAGQLQTEKDFNVELEELYLHVQPLRLGERWEKMYTLWWTDKKLWKITMFNGKIHYKWPFSIAMLNYQRVVFFFEKSREELPSGYD